MKKSIHFTSFSKQIFSIYLNTIEIEEKVKFMSLKMKGFSYLEHGPKSDKSASAFLKLCFHLS